MDFNAGSGGTAGLGGPPKGRVERRVGHLRLPLSSFNYRDSVRSFIKSVDSVVTAPVGFFRGNIGHGDHVNPLIFAITCYEIVAIDPGWPAHPRGH